MPKNSHVIFEGSLITYAHVSKLSTSYLVLQRTHLPITLVNGEPVVDDELELLFRLNVSAVK